MKRTHILTAIMITAFMTTFMSSALNLSIPTLERFFGVNAATIEWVVSSYTITVAALSLPLGKLADITGHRRIFLTGIAGFGILCLASAFSPGIGMLITLRALMGACGSMLFATNNAILINAYPSSMRGRALGYSVSATYIGLTAGPVLGGILNSTLGWRSIFLVSTAVSAAAFLAAFPAVPKDSKESGETEDREPFDLPGTALYLFAILASLFGMTNLGSLPGAALVFAAGVAALAAFFVYEKRRETSGRTTVMKVSMFQRSRTFTFSNLAALLNYGATFAISYTLSIYLQVIRDIPSGKAGLLLIIAPAAQAVFSPLAGSLSDRIRPGLLASAGMGLCVITLVMYSFIGLATPLWYIPAALALTGLGFALFSSPNNNAILSCVDPGDYGVANSIIATMRTYGQSSGMAVLTILTAMILGDGSLAGSPKEDILRLMHVSFLLFAVICLVGVVFSLARDSGK